MFAYSKIVVFKPRAINYSCLYCFSRWSTKEGAKSCCKDYILIDLVWSNDNLDKFKEDFINDLP